MFYELSCATKCFSLAIILRIGLLFFGIWQDANTSLRYTDIDYYVFTDGAHFAAQALSPFDRHTYRYTPLLAWILWPTTLSNIWFSFGKVLFATGDIVAGWLIVQILEKSYKMSNKKALAYASIWLLNPMVAIISTRGSAEGLLGALVVALLWAVLYRRLILAGILLGLGVHFKIYPFIYAPSIIWWLDDENTVTGDKKSSKRSSYNGSTRIWDFFNSSRLTVAVVSLGVFMALNILMYLVYGFTFLQQTYLYHFTRTDHRHNFSPYNIYIYLTSSHPNTSGIRYLQLAFIPQLFLSAIAIPLALAKKDLPSTMLAQTFAFVSFNKVCTSQYFIWYLVFLPFYLPKSTLISQKLIGILAATLWVATQAAWLQQASQLEFLGKSTFIPGLCLTSILFFLVNTWILGIIVQDIGFQSQSNRENTFLCGDPNNSAKLALSTK